MVSNEARWAELRAQGRWSDLWADVRANGNLDDLATIDRDLSPEERSADNAAREALAQSPAISDRLDAIAARPLHRVLERIERAEGREQRELAEAGRKLALAERRASHHDQPA